MFRDRRERLLSRVFHEKFHPEDLQNMSRLQRWRYLRALAADHVSKVKRTAIINNFLHVYNDDRDKKERNYLIGLLRELEDSFVEQKQKFGVYRTMRAGILLVGASVPVLAVTTAPRWLLAALSSVVVVAEGILQLLRYQEQAIIKLRLYRQLYRELELFTIHAGDYADTSGAFNKFVDATSRIKQEADDGLLGILQQPTSFGGPKQSEPERPETIGTT